VAQAQLDILDIRAHEWTDWKWQQRNAIRSVEQLLEAFPGLDGQILDAVSRNQEYRRFQITPYAVRLVKRIPGTLLPEANDPLWRQFVPYWPDEGLSDSAYDGHTENWEMPGEMVTPIAQHKYDNRVIVRLANVCLAYCQFCYEALRTLEKDSPKLSFQQKHWDDTIEYLRRTPAIEEVILSGGEPLMHPDEQLDRILLDLDTVGRPIVKRIHTRALTFNPFRVTGDLLKILSNRKVAAVGLHVSHPNEITPEFLSAVERLHGATPILFANIPLLGGINDSVEVLRELGMRLYSNGVIPHYLYHFMPHSPGAAEFRTPVQRGIDIVRFLKRRVSNLAVPEFVLPHHSGKFTPALLGVNEPPLTRMVNADGHVVVRYTNWLGNVVDYPDEGSGVTDAAATMASTRAERARLEVDLRAIRRNAELIAEVAGGAKVMAVLKANAYGMGAVPISRELQQHGVAAFATDNVAEAIELRTSGISGPILIIDGDQAGNAAAAVAYGLMPGIADEELLHAYERAAHNASAVCPIWLVANVGFNRSGYRDVKAFARFAEAGRRCSHLDVRGVYAHLTDSNGDAAVSRAQIAEYRQFWNQANSVFGRRLESSLFASHGILRWAREFRTDWVRPGLLLFGEHAFLTDLTEPDTLQVAGRFHPALQLRARVIHLLAFTRAEGVGYGRRVQTRAGQQLATVAVGFGSGYPLRGNGLRALIRENSAPLFGDTGMDALQVDVTGIPDVSLNDWITLAGTEGHERISFQEIASRAGTTVYQLLSGIRCHPIHLHQEGQVQ
jgi:lysine 2,3-aminomutase